MIGDVILLPGKHASKQHEGPAGKAVVGWETDYTTGLPSVTRACGGTEQKRESRASSELGLPTL
jgi:hypothetical protein